MKKKIENLNIEMRYMGAIAKLAYACTLVAMVLVLFVGCNVTESDSADTVVTASHPKACIESFPVVPDTLIKGLETWSLKVGNGTRNRCRWDVGNEWAECKAKNPDTLYVVDTYCPATLKARAELGGN